MNPSPRLAGPWISRSVSSPLAVTRIRVTRFAADSAMYSHSSSASNFTSFVKAKPSAATRKPCSSNSRMYPSAKVDRSALSQGFTRVDTVIQMRSLESRMTKLTLPSGFPSRLSYSVRILPSRVMSSRRSVPKLAMRMSPVLEKARPFGNVPKSRLCSLFTSKSKWSSGDWAMSACVPSGLIRMTPPRASAAHRVPSRSARMHSGRRRSCPIVRIADLSTCQPLSGLGPLPLLISMATSPGRSHVPLRLCRVRREVAYDDADDGDNGADCLNGYNSLAKGKAHDQRAHHDAHDQHGHGASDGSAAGECAAEEPIGEKIGDQHPKDGPRRRQAG